MLLKTNHGSINNVGIYIIHKIIYYHSNNKNKKLFVRLRLPSSQLNAVTGRYRNNIRSNICNRSICRGSRGETSTLRKNRLHAAINENANTKLCMIKMSA